MSSPLPSQNHLHFWSERAPGGKGSPLPPISAHPRRQEDYLLDPQWWALNWAGGRLLSGCASCNRPVGAYSNHGLGARGVGFDSGVGNSWRVGASWGGGSPAICDPPNLCHRNTPCSRATDCQILPSRLPRPQPPPPLSLVLALTLFVYTKPASHRMLPCLLDQGFLIN